jgi:hypothetical protein
VVRSTVLVAVGAPSRGAAPTWTRGVALGQRDVAGGLRFDLLDGVQAGTGSVRVAQRFGGFQAAQGVHHAHGAEVVEARVGVGEQGVLSAAGETTMQPPGALLAGGAAEHRRRWQAQILEQRRERELFGDVANDQGGPQAVAGAPDGDQRHQRALARTHHADEVEQPIQPQDRRQTKRAITLVGSRSPCSQKRCSRNVLLDNSLRMAGVVPSSQSSRPSALWPSADPRYRGRWYAAGVLDRGSRGDRLG